MRHNRSQTKQRRSHHALKAPALSVCTNCNAQHLPHHMCLSCGYYNGRQVMDLEADKAKRDARIKAKEERIKIASGTGDSTEAPAPKEADTKDEAAPKKEKGKKTEKEAE